MTNQELSAWFSSDGTQWIVAVDDHQHKFDLNTGEEIICENENIPIEYFLNAEKQEIPLSLMLNYFRNCDFTGAEFISSQTKEKIKLLGGINLA